MPMMSAGLGIQLNYSQVLSKYGANVANFIGKADNAFWLLNKMLQTYRIVDMGIDVTRQLGNSSYKLESILSYFYQNKEIAIEFMKGCF